MKSNVFALTLLAASFVTNIGTSIAEERIQYAKSSSNMQSGNILIDRKTLEDSSRALLAVNQTHARAMNILRDVEGDDLLTRVNNAVNMQAPTLKDLHISKLRDKELSNIKDSLRFTRSELDSTTAKLEGAKAELNKLQLQLASVTSQNSQLQETLNKAMAERDDWERKYLSEHKQLRHVVLEQHSTQTQKPETQQVEDVNDNAQVAPQVENTQN